MPSALIPLVFSVCLLPSALCLNSQLARLGLPEPPAKGMFQDPMLKIEPKGCAQKVQLQRLQPGYFCPENWGIKYKREGIQGKL